MGSGRFGWLLSLQARLILASVAIVVLAIFVTSGVFVYRDRQEQRADTLKKIASATRGFSVSAFVPGEPRSLEIPAGTGVPASIVPSGDVFTGREQVLSEKIEAANAIKVEAHEINGGSDYRILLVNGNNEVVNDPAGSLAGVKLTYPAAGIVDEKRGYVTWPGEAASSTEGLTFLAPVTKQAFDVEGLKAVAAINSTSLTADWLATAPDLGLSALVGLPIAMAAVVLVTRRITRPLQSLTYAVEAMSRGDFDQRVDVRGRDEVAALASSFTLMAGRVKDRDTQLRNLIANVSHDLRTPLTSIQGYAEALADGVTGPDEVDRTARIIRDEARHASSLLANLLSLSEIESGEVVMRRADYALVDLTSRCLRRMEPRAKARGVAIYADVIPEPPLAGDPEKIERAICNLVENAVKFARSRVDVTVTCTPAEARLSIRNDGPPIPPADAERIFERFYRSGGPNSGSGLGLAIARELVELHGGRIELVSAGSPVEFCLTLPAS